MDYENRTDFRAFDVMVQALDRASHNDITNAYQTAMEMRDNYALSSSKRVIWGHFARMLSELEKLY